MTEPEPYDDGDDDERRCFGCAGVVVDAMEVLVTEPCPDVLGNIHVWHIQCFICHTYHGSFLNREPCQAEAES